MMNEPLNCCFLVRKIICNKSVKCEISEVTGLSKQPSLGFFRDYLLLHQQTWFLMKEHEPCDEVLLA